MPLTVSVVTPPVVEPVTLAEAKAHVRLDSDYTGDDSLLTVLISAARRAIEGHAKISCVNTVFDMVDDSFPFTSGYLNRQVRQFYGQFATGQGAVGVMAVNAGVITFPRAPLVSVASITYLDVSGNSQTLSPSRYAVTTGKPGRVAPVFGQVWPVTLPQIGAVTVRFTAGHGTTAASVPENLRAAVLLVLGHLYENREAVDVGQGNTLTELPMGVEYLLGDQEWGGYA